MGSHSPLFWPRAILLVDLNAFFASIEQRDAPELRGRPVVVTNGSQGTCIITCSYEARAYGIKTGMRIYEAQRLCPQLVRCPSRPHAYAQASTQIMQALQAITPKMEVFSVDEAFLDVTHCQHLHGTPLRMARMARKIIFESTGLLCSIGVSGDKTTAKYAAKLDKPNGITVIPPWEAQQRLSTVPVTQLCGIAQGIGQFLASYGVVLCGDMKKLPISVLARRFGNVGRRIWLMCQGQDPESVNTTVAPPKSIGHGKVMPPHTNKKEIILNYFSHMSEKVAARLRQYGFKAQTYYIAIALDEGWCAQRYHIDIPRHDASTIFLLCEALINECWRGEVVRQIQVTALDPQQQDIQLDFFVHTDLKQDKLNAMQDAVNERFGSMALKPGRLLGHVAMPDVIAPAWRPEGIRRSV